MISTRLLAMAALAAGLGAGTAFSAPPSTPQGLITGKAFLGITGGSLASLTNNAKFPNNPDVIQFPEYFEWAATGDIFTPPGNWDNNYGTQILGYFHPPTTGDYVFYISADDNAALYLSTDADPQNKKLIARESAWSNPRQYLESSGNSDLTMKDSSQFTGTEWPTKDPTMGGAKITLQSGRAYYIEALAKEGGGGDNLSVAVLDPNFAIDSSLPIPGQYLSSDRASGPVTITQQPQSQTVDERGSVTFRVEANGTPPYTYQWRKNGTDIPDATGPSVTVSGLTMADNNARFSVVVTGAQGTATGQDAVLTVAPDTTLPTVLGAKASPTRTQVLLTFSEPLEQASATATANYQISSSAGPLNVTGATLSESGTLVTLATAQQTLGTKYTVLISNIRDTAATPNTIAAQSRAVFFPTGKLIEQDGFIVFEAENFDRNLDDLWLIDTARGNPSAGASVVNPNGLGGSESTTKLEYDIEFKQAATYVVWYRASGNNGSDDSGWFHLNGERPIERSESNDAAMTGFSGAMDFVWQSNAFSGPDPFTVDVPNPGTHTIGLARREDGSFFDKFILTTDTTFRPTGFGPPETREGAPGLPTVSLSAPTDGATVAPGTDITLSVNTEAKSGLSVDRVEYTANGNVVGEATASPFSFTWSGVKNGVYAIRARAIDEIGQMTTSSPVTITVGTPPPQALLIVGTDSNPTLNAADAGVKARLESLGWQVSVVQAPASTSADADGKQLIVASSTINSGDLGDKMRDTTVPVINWEQALQDNFLMTLNTDGVDRGTATGQTQVNIVNAGHPLAAGLSAGPKTVLTEPQDFSWGLPGANAVKIATVADNPDQVVIYGYDKGAILADGTTPAPGRRVMWFSANNGFTAFTEDALTLFDAAVEWASGIAPQAKTSANIAWVSFHPADDTPSSAAASAGFTQAPDVGYTDLLESAGHNVTRFVSSGTPDTSVLNAFDLVVISRSVPSDHYQDSPETAAWNGLTAPTMILGGYVLRANRLQLMTGNTITDTGGPDTPPVRLTVNTPTHPIFEGIPLDAQNTMVNPFADDVTFNGTLQRGISVVTDPPVEGATVLASVGTPNDPAAGGMVIGEFPAGITAGRDTLAGRRLVFLTGSRENSGLTSQGSGIFDLVGDGPQLFLNAVNYMAGTTPAPQPTADVSIARTANGVSITFTGTLQSADSVTGPWTDVAGATSPFTVNVTGGQKFYRARE